MIFVLLPNLFTVATASLSQDYPCLFAIFESDQKFFHKWVATLHHCNRLKVLVGASTAFAKLTYPCHQIVATTQRMAIYIG